MRAKRDDQHVCIQVFEFLLALAQLCHVLAAGQSAQVTHKDQQGVAPALNGVGQRDGLAVYGRQHKVGSGVTWFE